MPRRIPLEPDTDAYLQQRSRHGIGGCAKNRIARCVLDEPRRYARATQICAVTYAGRAEFPKCARVSGCLGRTPSARRYYSLRESDESGASIRIGDRTGLVPPLDSEEPALADGLICHWTCIENGLYWMRQGETVAGTTRRFLESWADAFNRQAVAGERCDAHTSEADFILKNGRSFEDAALPGGVRMGRPRECFRNAATLALLKPHIYIYVEGYAVNRWIAMHTVALA